MNPDAPALVTLLTAVLSSFAPRLAARGAFNESDVAQVVEAAQRHRLPSHLLAAVCFGESTWGTRSRRYCGCGDRRIPRTWHAEARCGARVLYEGLLACRSLDGALQRYQSGRCRGDAVARAYAAGVLRRAEVLDQMAGRMWPLPAVIEPVSDDLDAAVTP